MRKNHFKKSKKTLLGFCKPTALFLSFILLFQPSYLAWALPADYTVESGEVSFDQSEPNTLTITASDNAIINFNSFSIAADETVRFIQPSLDSTVLSRVIGGSASDIFGSLFSNGILFLINANGINFSESATVQVGSLIASTLDISNANFLASNYLFEKQEGSGLGRITNAGDIQANGEGGSIALLAESIINRGTLTAYKGSVNLGAGEKETLSFDGQGLINLVVEEGFTGNYAEGEKGIVNAETGRITADQGKIRLTARDVMDTMKTLINNEGVLEANAVIEKNGEIEFVTNGGISSTGTIETRHGSVEMNAAGGIETLGILRAGVLNEKGASFRISGLFSIGQSYHDNLDGAILLLDATTLDGSQDGGGADGIINDVGDIIIDTNATVTLGSNITLTADTDGSNGGIFYMNSGSLIAGSNYDLTIYSGDTADTTFNPTLPGGTAPELQSIGDVKNLTLGKSGAASPAYRLTTNLYTKGDLNIDANLVLTAEGLTLAADTNSDGSADDGNGIFDMAGFRISGDDGGATTYSVTIKSAANNAAGIPASSQLGDSISIGTLTLGRVGATTPTFVANANITDNFGLTMNANTTLDMGNFNLGVGGAMGTLTNDGTIITRNGSFSCGVGGTNGLTGVITSQGTGNWSLHGTLGTFVNDGTLNLGSNGITMSNPVLLDNNGTINAGNANITFDGNFDNTTGTFNAGTSTLIFQKSDDSSSQTFTTDGDAFNNVTINNTNPTPGNESVIIVGNLNLGSTLYLQQGNLDLVTAATDPNVAIGGNFTVDNGATVSLGTGTWTFNGATEATYTDNNATEVLQNASFTVDGTNKVLNLAGAPATFNFNTVTIGGNDTLDINRENVAITTLTNNGTFRLQGDESVTITNGISTSAGTVEYDGTLDYTALGLAAGYNYYNLTLSGSGTFAAGANNLDVNGHFTQSGGTFSAPGAAQTFYVGGNMNLTGATAFTHNSGTVTFDGTSFLTSTNQVFNNIQVGRAGAAGSLSLIDNLNIDGVLSFDNSAGATSFAASNRTINYAGATLDLTTLDTFNSTDSTWIFDRGGTTTVTGDTTAIAFNNVTLGTGGNTNLTLSGTINIDGTLSANAAGTLTLNSANATVSYAGAALNLTNIDTFTATGSTWIFDGATTLTSSNATFNNIQLGTGSAGGSLTSADSMDIAGNLTVQNGGATTFDIRDDVINIAGNFDSTNLDTFTIDNSTINLDGVNQSISGSSTFYNFVKTASVADTLTFGQGTTQTITGFFTVQGATAINLLNLRSSSSGTAWKIDAQGARTIANLDVKDSNNINATAMDCPVSCLNSGGNTNWTLPSSGNDTQNSQTVTTESNTVISDETSKATNESVTSNVVSPSGSSNPVTQIVFNAVPVVVPASEPVSTVPTTTIETPAEKFEAFEVKKGPGADAPVPSAAPSVTGPSAGSPGSSGPYGGGVSPTVPQGLNGKQQDEPKPVFKTSVIVTEGKVAVDDNYVLPGEIIAVEQNGEVSHKMRTVYVKNIDQIKILRAKENTPLKQMNLKDGAVSGIAGSSDGENINLMSLEQFSPLSKQLEGFRTKGITGSTNVYANVVLNPNRNEAYITDPVFDTVYVVNPETMEVLGQLKTGAMPSQMAVTRDGNTLFVTNNLDGTVSKIDTRTQTVTPFQAGDNPFGLVLSRDEKTLFVSDAAGNTVRAFDASTFRAGDEIPVGESPHHLLMDPNGEKMFVSNQGENTVSVVDLSRNREEVKIEVGESPGGMAVTPEGDTLYVASLSGVTSVIDLMQQKKVADIPTGIGSNQVVLSSPKQAKIAE